jgi:pilus assembly protein CpaE
MPSLRTRLHLPLPGRPRDPGAVRDPAAAHPLSADPSAPDPALRLLDGGGGSAATVREPAGADAAGPADGPPDAAPIPLQPEPLRRAAPDGRPSPRPRRSRTAPAAPVGLLPDPPDAVPEDAARPLRLVLVEEMPEVAAHVREMLRGQPTLRLVQVVADGRQAVREVRELRADVVLVDALLQGRASGIEVLERLRATLPGTAVVALGVPQDAGLAERIRANADAVVGLPFGTIDLARGIRDAHAIRSRRDPASATRVVAVYAAKGGVGKTTLALNLAVALASTGVRTALVDGSLQYGDLRRLLHVDAGEPSICDLPTDCVRGSDLTATMRLGPAGVAILFAPPRLEMADMVTARDLDKIIDLLRRTYQAVVVDTPSALNDTTLTVLDMADVILQVLTPEPAALDSTRAAAAAFAAIGYPATKVRVVINRADAQGGLRPDQLRRALGREPDHVVASDWQLVSASNQEGVPFVVARPDAPISRDVLALAGSVMTVVGAAPSDLPVRVRTRARGRQRAAG